LAGKISTKLPAVQPLPIGEWAEIRGEVDVTEIVVRPGAQSYVVFNNGEPRTGDYYFLCSKFAPLTVGFTKEFHRAKQS
jgi:hypothetical protein